jgi:hypothetical protein
VWLQFAAKCGYLPRESAAALYKELEQIIGMLVSMANHSQTWVLK